jgi:hypothetical protein
MCLNFLLAATAQTEQWRLAMAIWKSPTCLVSMKPCMCPCQRRDFLTTVATSPTAELALPNHVDTTVSQPFRRWMSTLRRRYLERGKGWHTGASRLSFDLEDGNTDGTIPSNHLHESICRMSELITSSIGMKTASMTVGSTSIALRSDPG